MQLTFTNVFIRHMLEARDTPAIVLQWLRAEHDPKRREIRFAQQLAEDFKSGIDIADEEPDPDPEALLKNDLLELAGMKTNWRRVARAVLRHFTIPITTAMLASAGDPPNRLAHLLASWRGPVN